MGEMRQAQLGTCAPKNHNKLAGGYKDDIHAHHWYRGPNPPTRSAAVVAVGIMVSAWLIVKAFVAIAPLSYAQYVNTSLPLLLDATGEELTLGLEEGHFTSVDLVQVSGMLYCLEDMGRPVADTTQAYVARILEVNSTLHMVTEINPDAWAIAKELDEERACGKLRGYSIRHPG
jgi:amidase